MSLDKFNRKKYPRCNRKKNSNRFYKHKARKDGLASCCINCFKFRITQPLYRAGSMWNGINKRLRNKNNEYPSYKNVKLLITREEFIEWAIPEIENFVRRFPKQTPSLDRIKNNAHYELGNLQILELGENSRKTNKNKNFVAPKGKAWCPSCKNISQLNYLIKIEI